MSQTAVKIRVKKRFRTGEKTRKDQTKTRYGAFIVAALIWLAAPIHLIGHNYYSVHQVEFNRLNVDVSIFGEILNYRLLAWAAITGAVIGTWIGKTKGVVALFFSFFAISVAYALWRLGTLNYYSKNPRSSFNVSETLFGATVFDYVILIVVGFLLLWKTAAALQRSFRKHTKSKPKDVVSD